MYMAGCDTCTFLFGKSSKFQGRNAVQIGKYFGELSLILIADTDGDVDHFHIRGFQ